MYTTKALIGAFGAFAALVTGAPTNGSSVVNQTTCNGLTYTYQELAGYGLIPSQARDKFGDTIGGIGSSIAIEKWSWKKIGGTYIGVLWAIPDRGWNTEGTLNFQSRVHKFLIEFTPSLVSTTRHNLQLEYFDTILLFGPDGKPTTGLDADATGYLPYHGFPDLPAATYKGDGYGGAGPGDKRISLDCEGLVVNEDGTFWVSDEYGPYVYKFNPFGKMTLAIRPPDAFIPLRNGTESFNSDSAPYYDQNRTTTPEDPTDGRSNNQGFEGLTLSPDGKTLSVLLQSALMQEGGTSGKNRFNSRLVQYDLTHGKPQYKAEYVVQLPQYINAAGDQKIAAQSEIHAISNTQFFVLARDSSAGRGQDVSLSVYRHADIFDISNATNVMGAAHDATNATIASTKGKLNSDITAATYCTFLDYNVNSQLNRFGLHNGGDQGVGLLNEKWESLSMMPINGDGSDGEYYLFSMSDNDFITTKGYLNFGRFKYQDVTDLDNQALVFKIQIPKSSSSHY